MAARTFKQRLALYLRAMAALNAGEHPRDIAADLGVSPTTIRNWRDVGGPLPPEEQRRRWTDRQWWKEGGQP